jgi:ubiquinone/menaquinone biosynthesis C-methylase UbiE
MRCDAKKLPFENGTFDYASLGEVLEHQMTLEDCKQVLSEVVRVSKNVILSVPNEYLWSDSCEKFFSYEDDVKRHNGDLVAMAKRSAPFAKDWDKQFTHIFHHHHFSPYEVEDLIKSVTDREYNIYILPNCGNKDIGMVGTTAAIIHSY